MDTSVGLSTIASLSLGLSMSMTGSGRAAICRNLGAALPTSDDQRSAREPAFPCLPQLPRTAGLGGVLQAGFAGPQRRTSFVGILHQMSAQNRLLPSQQDPSSDAVRRSSVSEVHRAPAAVEPPTSTAKHDDGVEKRRPASDGAPGFSVDTAPTSHNAAADYDDVITSRDHCEYTVNMYLLGKKLSYR